MLRTALAYVRSFLRDERAQDAFEYLLVIGGVSVAVIMAIATPAGGLMVQAVIDGVCTAINALPQVVITPGACTP